MSYGVFRQYFRRPPVPADRAKYLSAPGTPGQNTLSASAGSFVLSGVNAALEASFVLEADAGSFTLTGQDANLDFAYLFQAETGSFALTGQAADLHAAFVLDAEVGSFTLTGVDANLNYATTMDAEAGSFALTGQTTDLHAAFVLEAETGSIVLTGTAADLHAAFVLEAETGSIVLTGVDATLNHNTTQHEFEGFRFRNDDGSESAATWIVAQDTNITKPKGVNVRLRTLVDMSGNDAGSEQVTLQYRKVGDADWKTVQ